MYFPFCYMFVFVPKKICSLPFRDLFRRGKSDQRRKTTQLCRMCVGMDRLLECCCRPQIKRNGTLRRCRLHDNHPVCRHPAVAPHGASLVTNLRHSAHHQQAPVTAGSSLLRHSVHHQQASRTVGSSRLRVVQ